MKWTQSTNDGIRNNELWFLESEGKQVASIARSADFKTFWAFLYDRNGSSTMVPIETFRLAKKIVEHHFIAWKDK